MGGSLKILYVEDNKEDFDTISTLLKRSKTMKFEIEWAKNSEEFYSKSKDCEYDAFIIDYLLGPVNGLDLIRKSNISAEKPIIILTGYGSEDLDKQAFEAGASFFVDKDSITEDWEILGKILRYSSSNGKRVYNSAKSGVRLQSVDEVEKVSQIFDFDYLRYAKSA